MQTEGTQSRLTILETWLSHGVLIVLFILAGFVFIPPSNPQCQRYQNV